MNIDILKTTFPSLVERELLNELSDVGILKEIEEGKVLMEIGDYIKSVPLLLDGLIRISREDEEGKEIFLYYIEGGQTCAMSLTCCMEAERSNIRAISEVKSSIFFIPVQYMDEWMHKYRSWKNFVMRSYSLRFEEMLRTIDSIAFENMDERLWRYLQKRAQSVGKGLLNLTHQQIALDLNASREAISRLLKKLEKQGKVTLGRNRIEILEVKGKIDL